MPSPPSSALSCAAPSGRVSPGHPWVLSSPRTHRLHTASSLQPPTCQCPPGSRISAGEKLLQSEVVGTPNALAQPGHMCLVTMPGGQPE